MASPAPTDATPTDAVAASSATEPQISQGIDASTQPKHIKIVEHDSTSRSQKDADQGSLQSTDGSVKGKGNGNDVTVSTRNELQPVKQRADRPTSIVPPFWQHTRQASRVSVASSLGAAGIRMEDNTQEEADEHLDANASGLRSPLWARQVDIDEYVRVEGDIKGVGGYIVWLVKVQTLDSHSSIVLRKRYSEFESLREQLAATFPNAGSSLPQLPPKSVFYKFRSSFLEKRRVGLQYFLNCILLNPEFAGCPAVRDFIFG